jgi:hypothetical protein
VRASISGFAVVPLHLARRPREATILGNTAKASIDKDAVDIENNTAIVAVRVRRQQIAPCARRATKSRLECTTYRSNSGHAFCATRDAWSLHHREVTQLPSKDTESDVKRADALRPDDALIRELLFPLDYA